VARANSRRSRFATLGCDHWIRKAPRAARHAWEAGLYVDLAFDRLETASRGACLDFVKRLQAACRRAGPKRGNREVEVIRVVPQRVHFHGLAHDTAWMLSVWVFGAGDTPAAALARRERGLAAVADVCDAVSRDLTARLGAAGTPVPP
jgi:hypothetical protein